MGERLKITGQPIELPQNISGEMRPVGAAQTMKEAEDYLAACREKIDGINTKIAELRASHEKRRDDIRRQYAHDPDMLDATLKSVHMDDPESIESLLAKKAAIEADIKEIQNELDDSNDGQEEERPLSS